MHGIRYNGCLDLLTASDQRSNYWLYFLPSDHGIPWFLSYNSALACEEQPWHNSATQSVSSKADMSIEFESTTLSDFTINSTHVSSILASLAFSSRNRWYGLQSVSKCINVDILARFTLLEGCKDCLKLVLGIKRNAPPCRYLALLKLVEKQSIRPTDSFIEMTH